MDISEINKWEKAIALLLKIDGWDLEWVGDKNLPYDAIGTTPKGYDCVMEMKFRDKYYEDKLLEKYKYDELMKLNVVALYFVNDPKGNFLYWLNNLELPEPTELYCPSTTLWNSKKVKKPVYLLKENQASIINLNKSIPFLFFIINKIVYIYIKYTNMNKTNYYTITDIEVDGILLEVEYAYTAGEDAVPYYPDGSGYPGSPARVDIYKVTAGGDDDLIPLLSDFVLEDIETQIHKIYDENYEA